MNSPITNMKEMFGDDLKDILTDFSSEVGGLAEELLNTTTESSEWNDVNLKIVLNKLHGIKGITSQIGFTDLSKAVHMIEDKIAEQSKVSKYPNTEILFKISDFSEKLLDFMTGLKADESLDTLDKLMNAAILELTQDKENKSNMSENTSNQPAKEIKTELSISDEDFQSIFDGLNFSLELLRDDESNKLTKYLLPQLENSLFHLFQARVVPVKNLVSRLRKLIRELSANLDKKIELSIEGEYESMDRILVNSLAEIMVHLVRNAMDHGIESPEDRLKQNKNETAKLVISFKNMGDRSLVIIKDDGRGINPDIVAKKALEKNIVTQQELNNMTSYEKQELIFRGGFSTKESATEVSGRGVGMDAVLTEIHKMSGQLIIDSKVNVGTEFIMEFPSPYQMESAILFEINNQNYSIPTKFIKGIADSNDDYHFEFGALEINSHESPYLSLNLTDLYQTTNDHKGPFILLSLSETPLCLPVDKIKNIQALLINKHSRTENLPKYINGLSFDKNGTMHFAFDCTELERNLNTYLEGEQQPQKEIKQNNQGANVIKLDKLEEGEMITQQQIINALEGPETVSMLKEILASLEAAKEEKNKAIEIITKDIQTFKDTIEDIEDGEELQYIVAVQYARIKSTWISLNIQMQYMTFAGKEPDAKSMYMASMYSAILNQVEKLANKKAIMKITETLQQPMNDEN
ncbi:MAG: ATP-binding protein [Bdellovibrionales bacterium]|nr:ATP-binding protein [Bdellovibrionales bacterium]